MIKTVLSAIAVICICASCGSARKAGIYFGDIQDSTINLSTQNLEPVIQKNDLLSITISSLNEEATTIFNSPNAASDLANGYLVNQDGTIEFPIFGNIKAAGLTKTQFRDELARLITEGNYLKNPVVTVRYLNFKITVLGEVARPAVINVPSERISILEALGLAGDMTVFAKRDNVMVLREEGGKRIIKRVNMNNREILTSPYYYLKSNDIVYVEPNKAKISGSGAVRVWLPVVLSSLSLITLLIYRLNN